MTEETQPEAVATAEPMDAPRDFYQPHKTKTLWAFLGLLLLSGVADAFITPESGAYKAYHILSLVVFAVVIMRWYVLDAAQHHYRISKPMFFMLVGVNVLAAPFYFFATRGKGAWRAMGRALVFLLLGGIVSALGQGLGDGLQALLHIAPIK